MNGTTFTASKGVVLNTGTEPSAPPIEGLADTPYWTNRDALRTAEIPGSLIVVGGGAIGAELAQAYSRFGVQVTVLEVADRMLAPEEPEASRLVADVFGRQGIQVLAGVTISSVSYDDGHFSVEVDGQTLQADKLLVAAGRRPNLADLGLDTVGLDPSARSLDTDGRMRAGDGLWAIGDITGKGAFTHMSMYQAAIVAARHPRPGRPRGVVHRRPARHLHRPGGRLRRDDREAGPRRRPQRPRGYDGPRLLHARLDRQGRGVHQAGRGRGPGRARGRHVGRPDRGEVLGMLVTAVHAGVPTDTLRSMIFAYPTFHRAVEDALSRLA